MKPAASTCWSVVSAAWSAWHEKRSLYWVGLLSPVAVAALALATFGLRGWVRVWRGSGTAAASVDVTLAEFTITPQMISLPPEGGTLRITNTGTAVHSLSVPEIGMNTGDIAPGATVQVKIGRVAPGMYTALLRDCRTLGERHDGVADDRWRRRVLRRVRQHRRR